MIRFILKKKTCDTVLDLRYETYETLTLDVPELEEKLRSGGYGPSGYEITEFVGVEINPMVPFQETES